MCIVRLHSSRNANIACISSTNVAAKRAKHAQNDIEACCRAGLRTLGRRKIEIIIIHATIHLHQHGVHMSINTKHTHVAPDFQLFSTRNPSLRKVQPEFKSKILVISMLVKQKRSIFFFIGANSTHVVHSDSKGYVYALSVWENLTYCVLQQIEGASIRKSVVYYFSSQQIYGQHLQEAEREK